MYVAGRLHDLGKLAVNDRILEKDGKLEPNEFAVIKSHTYYTARLMENIPEFSTIREWASYHHERLDGKGYPFGLGAAELNLGARIMAVADVFTAIKEDRPYRDGKTDDAAIKVLRSMAGPTLDPRLVQLLIENFEEVDTLRIAAQTEEDKAYMNYLSSTADSRGD